MGDREGQPGALSWTIVLTRRAEELLGKITDRRERRLVAERIDRLTHDPEKQGKALAGNLAGYRSVRAAGQRCRVLYRLEDKEVVVVVVTLGRRKEGDKKDVYALAKKLLRLRLLDV